MSLKETYKHLEYNELVKYMFTYEFDNEEWTKITLSRVHGGKIWLGDNVVEILANLIHKFTILCNGGAIAVNEKNVKKVVLKNTKSINNGR